MATAEFRVLGDVEARVDGARLHMHSRQRAVLAILLVEVGRTVTVDQLADRLWGPAPPRSARETLHSYLSRLRSALRDAAPIIRDGGGYLLDLDPQAVDMHRFSQLVAEARAAGDAGVALLRWDQALALWQGEPFHQLDLPWLNAVGQGLANQRLSAFLDRNDLWLRQGGHDRLLPELTTAAGVHPLDERLAGQLLLALYRAGRPADALAHYAQLRQRLVDELGCEPGPALRHLHHQILTADSSLAPTAAPAPAPSPSVADAQAAAPGAGLPRDVPAFVGRRAQLAALDQLLEARAPLVAVSGAGGVGKSTLVVHWAHRVRDRFPDGQLYVNLRGFDPAGRAMDPGEALQVLLELLRVPPKQIPTSVEAQSSLYRSRLAGARMLVVLDNARDAEQVRPLLPSSPGSMALVTSRGQLAGLVAAEGARPVRLDVLDDVEARQLLSSRLGAELMAAEPAAANGIIAACAGLPLALAIATARAAARPEFLLAVLAGELADARDRLDALATADVATDVRAVFSWSYHALSPPAARLFRLLGLHPGPDVGPSAAASLAGVPLPQTRRLLAELTDAHLLTEHAPGRYVSHDLLRAYAAELAQELDPEPDRAAAQHRMLDHYLHTAHRATLLLNPHQAPIALAAALAGVTTGELATAEDASGWLSTEFPILLAAPAQACQLGRDLHAWQLVWALTEFLIRRGPWRDLLTLHQLALSISQRLADQQMQADSHRRLGGTHRRLGNYQEAHTHLRLALEAYRTLGHQRGQALSHTSIAITYELQGRYREAVDHAHEALALARAIGDLVEEAANLNGLGWLHAQAGEYQHGLTYCKQAVAIEQKVGNRNGEANAWDSIAYIHHHLGEHQQAVACYERAAAMFHEKGDRHSGADALTRLGETHQAIGDHDAAREAWQQALEILDQLGHQDAADLRRRLACVEQDAPSTGS